MSFSLMSIKQYIKKLKLHLRTIFFKRKVKKYDKLKERMRKMLI